MKTKTQTGGLLFTAAFFLLCLLPSVGMLFAGEQEAVGNEQLTPFPQLRSADGGWNRDFCTDLSDYVADHIAFRHEMITLNSMLNNTLFSVVTNEDVLAGADGWLYYTDTLADYQGVQLLSDRQCFSAARTLQLMQEYCAARGAEFLFTVAPNKNSLYSGAMPARYRQSGWAGNAQRIEARLQELGVGYQDLFETFRAQEEVLYFRTDSHWNSRGAALAGDALGAALARADKGFYDAPCIWQPIHQGDLYEMVYPAGGQLEQDVVYLQGWRYSYAQGYRSPEDITIRTSCPEEGGSLLMFRDSFGNLLHPFMAEQFGAACFSRAMPYNMSFVDREGADTVVVEIVERNLSWLVTRPVLMPAPVREATFPQGSTGRPVQAEKTESNAVEGCFQLSGTLGEQLDEDSPLYLRTSDGTVYEATPAGAGEQPFTLFLPSGTALEGACLGFFQDGNLVSCPVEVK